MKNEDERTLSMNYGMPTLIECPSFEQSLALCVELSSDFIESNVNLLEYQLDRFDISNAKRLVSKIGKYVNTGQ
jgi:hypothetical protein